ncbi:hypothetical protein GGI12_003159 [Dipsacomyces acuminosporus]|nr:hypothetical protein GGI12_003159 [Dipsacomyces acuminosporus]
MFDIDALCTDYVKAAKNVAGHGATDTTRRLFVAAASIAAENTDTRIVFLELYPREHLVLSMQGECVADAAGLNRITIKYTSTVGQLKALMASWHCSLPSTGTASAYKERDFLIWDSEGEETRLDKASNGAQIPDCLFIDGIDAIPSEDRQVRNGK